jgi:hypothetical protein
MESIDFISLSNYQFSRCDCLEFIYLSILEKKYVYFVDKRKAGGMMGAIEQGCLICDNQEMAGIYVLEKKICLECERGILETALDDPKYDEYRSSLKKLWFGS